MSLKQKISARKIIQALLTMVLAGACVVAVMSATRTQQSKTLKGVNIRIQNDQYGFVTKDEIKSMLLSDRNVYVHDTKLSKLNVKQMEHVIAENPWVENAQVYIDNKQQLHAIVTQRVPMVRIFEKSGNSYYLDKRMEFMPLSDKYSYYTTVVTNVPNLIEDTAFRSLKVHIAAMVQHIKRDSFWNAQVSQLIVRDDLTFELVPVLGNHQVIFGDTSNMQIKFDNLFAFYTNVLNKVGWDKYQVLDLSYNGQLVAAPSLNWRMPVDKVINNINWVNSILSDDQVLTTAITAKPVKLAAMNAPANNVTIPVAEKKVEKKQEAAPAKQQTAAQTVVPAVKKQVPEVSPAAKHVVEKKKVEVAVKPPAKKENAKSVQKEEKKILKKKVEPVKPQPLKQEKKEEQENKKPKYIYNG